MKRIPAPSAGQPCVPARRRLLTPACLLAAALASLALRANPPVFHHPNVQPVRFAVISDPHLYDARLGTTGSAFETCLAADPKLLALSEPILQAAVRDIIRSNVRFVIVSGDLTKDGELVDHLLMVRYLGKLKRAGIQVFVVPGNHDINNHDAARYSGDTATPIPTVGPLLFRLLYSPFGYGQAIDRAPDSLSYVAEPVPGLWLLALDSVKWQESAQSEHPVVGGRLSDATLAWALQKLQQAQVRGKKVIAFMHHGVNLHFGAEPTVFGDFLVDNWRAVGPTLANAGLKVIFTGHYHSQDAAWLVDASDTPLPDTLCDIETGSLVVYPCAWRIAELDSAGQLHVTSPRITSIPVDLGGVPFQIYAENFLEALLPYKVGYELKYGFGLDDATIATVEPGVIDAVVANYAGDEEPTDAVYAFLGSLVASSDPRLKNLGLLLYTLWIDPPPADNTLDVPVSA